MTKVFKLIMLVAFMAGLGIGSPAKAQAIHTEALNPPLPTLVQTPAPTLDKVAFLTALARIESDVKLGALFVHDGLDDQAALHFAAPRAETIPAIAETLQSLGLVDFDARFADLEAASGDDAVKAAVFQAMRELSKARLKLRPTAQQKIQSITEQLVAAAAMFNPDGPTDVAAFQDAWGMVMVAGDQINLFARGKDSTLLGRTPDPALITGAQELGPLVENVLIDLPDPAIPVPVLFDPASFTTLITKMQVLAG